MYWKRRSRTAHSCFFVWVGEWVGGWVDDSLGRWVGGWVVYLLVEVSVVAFESFEEEAVAVEEEGVRDLPAEEDREEVGDVIH